MGESGMMQITRLSPTTAEKAIPLYREMFDLKKALLPEGLEFQEKVALQSLQERAQNGVVYIVEDGEDVVGAVVGQLLSYPYFVGYFAELQFFYVTPSARGQNVARALLEALICWARSRKALELNVGWDHMVSRKDQLGLAMLYQGLGFKEQGKVYSLEVH